MSSSHLKSIAKIAIFLWILAPNQYLFAKPAKCRDILHQIPKIGSGDKLVFASPSPVSHIGNYRKTPSNTELPSYPVTNLSVGKHYFFLSYDSSLISRRISASGNFVEMVAPLGKRHYFRVEQRDTHPYLLYEVDGFDTDFHPNEIRKNWKNETPDVVRDFSINDITSTARLSRRLSLSQSKASDTVNLSDAIDSDNTIANLLSANQLMIEFLRTNKTIKLSDLEKINQALHTRAPMDNSSFAKGMVRGGPPKIVQIDQIAKLVDISLLQLY